jgi:ketosteroid isomerase-like protein
MMNSRFRALGAVLASLTAFSAARAASAQDTGAAPDERALIKLERDWVDAETRHDAAALRSILDDRFIATFGGGKPLDKEAFIKGETEGAPDPTVSQELSDQKVIVVGGTGVIVETDTLRRMKDGKPVMLTWRFTVTYVKRGDRWLALAEQGGPTNP